MTPYELAKLIHQDISSFAPKLSADLNRALVDIGEGSVILGLGPGTHENDPATFREIEEIDIAGTHKAEIIARISSALSGLEEHSSWRVEVDMKPGGKPDKLELMYTLYRDRTRC